MIISIVVAVGVVLIVVVPSVLCAQNKLSSCPASMIEMMTTEPPTTATPF